MALTIYNSVSTRYYDPDHILLVFSVVQSVDERLETGEQSANGKEIFKRRSLLEVVHNFRTDFS